MVRDDGGEVAVAALTLLGVIVPSLLVEHLHENEHHAPTTFKWC
jgi:hypothetical protein